MERIILKSKIVVTFIVAASLIASMVSLSTVQAADHQGWYWQLKNLQQTNNTLTPEQITVPDKGFNPTQPPFFVEPSQNIFSSLNGKDGNSLTLNKCGLLVSSGDFSLEIVSDEHVYQGSWLKANFTQPGQYFGLLHQSPLGCTLFNQDWSVYAANPTKYALRFYVLGAGNTFRVVLSDKDGRKLTFPIGLLVANSSKNQTLVAPFDFLVKRAPRGFQWNALQQFRIRADQAGWMMITDIQVVRFNPRYKIAMGVAGHDLQGAKWPRRLGNYVKYFNQKPSVGTYFTTLFEPIQETSSSDDHYSDIVKRATKLANIKVVPAVTLEFRSWAQITLANGLDPNAQAKISAERSRFNTLNSGGISYDDFINNYINQNRVLDAVNEGRLEPIIHEVARQMRGLGPIYLRLFHEPYFWFPWGIHDISDNQKFKDAWVRIGQIFQQEGATNVMFVMALDPYEPGGPSWSEIAAIPPQYLDIVELDGYTDPVLRQNAYLSANELFTKKLTEIDWQLQLIYPNPANRPSIALGEFAFSGDAQNSRPKKQIYDWFIHDLIKRTYPLTRFSILYTFKAGPRPSPGALNYSPVQEGYWSAVWQPQNPWYSKLLKQLADKVGFWQPQY